MVCVDWHCSWLRLQMKRQERLTSSASQPTHHHLRPEAYWEAVVQGSSYAYCFDVYPGCDVCRGPCSCCDSSVSVSPALPPSLPHRCTAVTGTGAYASHDPSAGLGPSPFLCVPSSAPYAGDGVPLLNQCPSHPNRGGACETFCGASILCGVTCI